MFADSPALPAWKQGVSVSQEPDGTKGCICRVVVAVSVNSSIVARWSRLFPQECTPGQVYSSQPAIFSVKNLSGATAVLGTICGKEQ